MSLEKIVIEKTNLIDEFVAFSRWVEEYQNVLLNQCEDFQTEEVSDFLKCHQEQLNLLNIRFHLLDMVKLTLEFSLAHIQPQKLTFMLPPTQQKEVCLEVANIKKRVQSDLESMKKLTHNLNESTSKKLTPLIHKADSLFCAILQQDSDKVEEALGEIQRQAVSQSSEGIIGEVAKITRDIYNLFQDFTQKNEFDELRSATQEMPDAVQKINIVMERLESAADQNLEYLEKFMARTSEKMEICSNLQQECLQITESLEKMIQDHPQLADSLGVVQEQIKTKLQGGYEKLITFCQEDETYFIEMMTNQGFQDLAGQTLKKIIDFMESLEMRLLELIRQYLKFVESTGAEEKEMTKGDFFTRLDKAADGHKVALKGPDDLEGQKSSQNDVDALLAGLGF